VHNMRSETLWVYSAMVSTSKSAAHVMHAISQRISLRCAVRFLQLLSIPCV